MILCVYEIVVCVSSCLPKTQDSFLSPSSVQYFIITGAIFLGDLIRTFTVVDSTFSWNGASADDGGMCNYLKALVTDIGLRDYCSFAIACHYYYACEIVICG